MFKEMDKNSESAAFLRTLPSLGPPPKAVLVVSAHWEESNFTVNAFRDGTGLLYDYYGFPEEAYGPNLIYPAPSDQGLQERTLDLLQKEFGPDGASKSKTSRGFDHGVFIPMKLAFPDARVPIVQVSLRSDLDASAHIRLGSALSPLLEDGVWIIGSGSTTHNLEIGRAATWVQPFVKWIGDTLEEANTKPSVARDKLSRIMELAPNALTAHPRTEHLLPLLVAFGAAFPLSSDDNPAAVKRRSKNLFSQTVVGTLSLDSFSFT